MKSVCWGRAHVPHGHADALGQQPVARQPLLDPRDDGAVPVQRVERPPLERRPVRVCGHVDTLAHRSRPTKVVAGHLRRVLEAAHVVGQQARLEAAPEARRVVGRPRARVAPHERRHGHAAPLATPAGAADLARRAVEVARAPADRAARVDVLLERQPEAAAALPVAAAVVPLLLAHRRDGRARASAAGGAAGGEVGTVARGRHGATRQAALVDAVGEVLPAERHAGHHQHRVACDCKVHDTCN